jgi:protein gp37
MAANTGIEWATHTFNPWSGCVEVSAGCTHCYAKRLPPGMRRGAEWGPSTARMPAAEGYWRQPLAWAKWAAAAGIRHRVFCASTADVFEPRADLDPWRARLWTTIEATPELDWLLLTKRPEHVARAVPPNWWTGSWPSNAWLGATIEAPQGASIQRVGHLVSLPAPIRFASCEPLLGDVATGLRGHLGQGPGRINWVIAGGESGSAATVCAMDPRWVRHLRDVCLRAQVPFFFKQWGEWASPALLETYGLPGEPGWKEWPDGRRSYRVGKQLAGRKLDGVEHLDIPTVTP